MPSGYPWLHNAQVPLALLEEPFPRAANAEGLVRVDLALEQGVIRQVRPAADQPPAGALDVRRGLVLPCFVDIHTHLDKGQVWGRAPNPDGTFDKAVATIRRDAQQHWQAEDLYRRMSFGLRCSYAHGTQALRTHLDCGPDQAALSLSVFARLQAEWRDRLTLQAVAMAPLAEYSTPAGVALADTIAATGQILGGVAYAGPDLDTHLDALFALAQERQLDLDLHADETGDPNSHSLRAIARAARRHNFQGQILGGHGCSLAVQAPEELDQTLTWMRQAGISLVSLPTCNLYLQDRQAGRTPRWRGVAPVQELHQAGIPVLFASDNCRDPFFSFGDHDLLEVFGQAVRIAHLDQPYGDWIRAVTQRPAAWLGLPGGGRLVAGAPADLIVFRGRSFSELLARPQGDRLVLRRGCPIDTTLPDYAELDDLMGPASNLKI